MPKNYELDLLAKDEAGENGENEPLHVYLTADSEDNLEVGEAMINAILQQTEEAKKFAIVAYDSNVTKRAWCENCG